MKKYELAIYKDGVNARRVGLLKSDCPYKFNSLRLRHIWLAGWHDKDLELENEQFY